MADIFDPFEGFTQEGQFSSFLESDFAAEAGQVLGGLDSPVANVFGSGLSMAQTFASFNPALGGVIGIGTALFGLNSKKKARRRAERLRKQQEARWERFRQQQLTLRKKQVKLQNEARGRQITGQLSGVRQKLTGRQRQIGEFLKSGKSGEMKERFQQESSQAIGLLLNSGHKSKFKLSIEKAKRLRLEGYLDGQETALQIELSQLNLAKTLLGKEIANIEDGASSGDFDFEYNKRVKAVLGG